MKSLKELIKTTLVEYETLNNLSEKDCQECRDKAYDEAEVPVSHTLHCVLTSMIVNLSTGSNCMDSSFRSSSISSATLNGLMKVQMCMRKRWKR